MANNTTGSIQTLAGEAGNGAFLDVRAYGVPRQFRYKGATGDKVVIKGSSTGHRTSEIYTRTVTADDEDGAFVITDDRAFPYVCVEVEEGNAGATATTTITAPPLATNLPNAAFTVGNDDTPSAFVDLRTQGSPRTLMYEGFDGDEVRIEGSDTGVDGTEYPILERGGAGWAVQDPRLPNYARIVRLSGRTPGARGGVAAMSNGGSSAAGSAFLQGGNAFGATGVLGTTDAQSMTVIASGETVFSADPATGNTSVLANNDVYLTAQDDVAATGDNITLTANGVGGDVTLNAADRIVTVSTGNRQEVVGGDSTETVTGSKTFTVTGGVGIGGVPHASALLDLQSTSKGFGVVSMTTAQRNAMSSPRAGLAVYDSTLGQFVYYNGVTWVVGFYLRANNTSGQSIPDAAVATVVTNWTVVEDTAAGLNATTGIYTMPAARRVVVAAELEYNAIAAVVGAQFSVGVYVNGTAVYTKREYCQVAAANVPRNPGLTTPPLSLAAGDQVAIRAIQDSGSGSNALSTVALRNFWGLWSV